jgi:hypothetical protein
MSGIAAAIGAAGVIGGSLISANASRNAANTQAEAANRATDTQWNMFARNKADLQPWVSGGQTGYAELMRLLGIGGTPDNPTFNQNAMLVKPFGVDDFHADPGYQFRLNEGSRNILNRRSALGGVLSGGTLRDLETYGQGLASDEYQKAYARYNTDRQNTYNRISGLSDTGVNAAGGVAKLGANVADNVSSLQYATGQAGAKADLGIGSAYSNALGQLTGNWLKANALQQQQGGSPYTASGYFPGDSTLGGTYGY